MPETTEKTIADRLMNLDLHDFAALVRRWTPSLGEPRTRFADTAEEDLAPEEAVRDRLADLVAAGASPLEAARKLFAEEGA